MGKWGKWGIKKEGQVIKYFLIPAPDWWSWWKELNPHLLGTNQL